MVSEDQKNVFNIQGPTYLAIYIRCEAEALFSTGAGLACTTRIILIISTYYLIPCLNYMYLNTERKSGVIHVEERLNNFTVCLKSVPVVVLISGVVGGRLPLMPIHAHGHRIFVGWAKKVVHVYFRTKVNAPKRTYKRHTSGKPVSY